LEINKYFLIDLDSMIKKISFSIALSLMLIGIAKADSTEHVVLEDAVGRRNVVVTDPQTDEKVFLHVKPGCGELLKNQSVTLVTQGNLNGNSDSLKISSTQQCVIDQAEPFTQKLYVRQFTLGNSEILASDETGQDYLIGYGELCQAMPQFREGWIFVLQGDQALAKGDSLYLPDRAGECSIDRLEQVTTTRPKNTPDSSDRQLPTGVTGLKAVVGNQQIYLSWKPAQDDHGISHYLVGYNLDPIKPETLSTQDMPNLTQTKSARLAVTGLENGQRYYFYVAAVDTSGNRSSDWATAQATPSDILTGNKVTPSLRVRIERETPQSLFLRWDRISNASRYSIYFDVDGKRAFANARYEGKTLQIRKSAERKGKTLTLTVRASGLYGIIKEEKIEFKF
jgi:hypothetical protein